jgi:hypothetical protein
VKEMLKDAVALVTVLVLVIGVIWLFTAVSR